MKKPQDLVEGDAEKALAMDLRSLTPKQFAGFNPRLQVLLAIRMLYDKPEYTRALSGVNVHQQERLMGKAQVLIIFHDPAFRSADYSKLVGPHHEALLDFSVRMHNAITDAQLPWIESEVADAFGQEVASLLRHGCEVARYRKKTSEETPSSHSLPQIGKRHRHIEADVALIPKDFYIRAREASQGRGLVG